MPDFFLISGLFLANVIDRDWRTYLDRKVVHFAYFYLLWMTIQFAVKAPQFAADGGYGEVAAALSAVVHRSVRHAVVHLPAAGVLRLHQADQARALAGRSGVSARRWKSRTSTPAGWCRTNSPRASSIATPATSPRVMSSRSPRARRTQPMLGIAGLLAWGLVNGTLVYFGYEQMPFISLALGLVGACAVVTVSALMTLHDVFKPLRYCGRNSIVIYLAFFLPMAATRTAAAEDACASTDIGTMSVVITAAGVIGSLALFWVDARHLGEVPVRAPGAVLADAEAGAEAGAAAGGISPQASPPRRIDSDAADGPHCGHADSRQIQNRRQTGDQDRDQARRSRKPCGAAAEKGRPPLSGRRLRLHLPRLSRAAAAHPQVGRPAGQRRARLLQHAVEAAWPR